jgi:hypothetical protein
MCKTRGRTEPEQRLTDEEINELVFADVVDSSAWGEPIAVRSSKGPRRIKRTTASEIKISDP